MTLLQYALRRLWLFVPSLVGISILTFFLSLSAPGDPVELLLYNDPDNGNYNSQQTAYHDNLYRQQWKALHFDLPTFYVTLSTAAYPDTLHRIMKKAEREWLHRLIYQYGNWEYVSAYRNALHSLAAADSFALQSEVKSLFLRTQYVDIQPIIDKIAALSLATHEAKAVEAAYQAMRTHATPARHWLPRIRFHGIHNQYHYWLTRLLQRDFGKNYREKRPVRDLIGERIGWTFVLGLLASALAYCVAIPLGVFSATTTRRRTDRVITTVLFALYAVPVFWAAMLLIQLLTNPQQLIWFPSYGVEGRLHGMVWWQVLGSWAHHLTLPVVCLTYPSLAYLARQMRRSMAATLQQDYLRTARAKGLPRRTIVWKHAFRNALLPIITLSANIFPSLVAGSVVVENIFSIPGLGKLLFDAIRDHDHPIVFAVVLLIALFTMVGYLIADLLLAIADPRIAYR